MDKKNDFIDNIKRCSPAKILTKRKTKFTEQMLRTNIIIQSPALKKQVPLSGCHSSQHMTLYGM